MLMVVSPAKNLDYKSSYPAVAVSEPQFMDKTQQLVDVCQQLSPADLSQLMGISDKLAILNAERFNAYQTPFTKENARPAIFAFNGDVYTGLDAATLSEDDLAFAQQHLRILSGLYGVLKPFDLMQAYRLEMGTNLAVGATKNLYEFWRAEITPSLNAELAGDSLLNLASNEYFSAVDKHQLAGQIVSPVFKDEKNGQYKIISFYAKKARGLMARYVITQRINDIAGIKEFNLAGYRYDEASSTSTTPVFLRAESDRT